MRARNIKPGFFKNEDLAECSLFARLLFIGLWCMADREGRLEKRPLRIKAEIFPYDSVDINGELTVIERKGFVTTYVVDGKKYLQVNHFLDHQRPHHTEAQSKLPDISQGCTLTVDSPLSHGEYPPDSLIPDSLIPDSLIPDSLIPDKKHLSDYSDDFLKFWSLYPNKVGKGDAWKSWKKMKPDIEKVTASLAWQVNCQKWRDGYIPNPATYINQKRWEDEPATRTNISKLSSVNKLLDRAKELREAKEATNARS